jgi:hypothetical protein
MKPRDPKDLPTAREVRAMLSYDRSTGELRWKPRRVTSGRPMTNRRARIWNERWAGKIAGGPDALGYGRIYIRGQSYYSHRVVWLIVKGSWPPNELEIDHADGNPGNNSFANLRLASSSENGANQRLSKANKLGLKGVSWSKTSKAFVAQLKVNKKLVYRGTFDCPKEAHRAYYEAAKRRSGRFARSA